MSGIYKRGPIWWLRTDPVTGKRLSTRCTSRAAALGFLADRERLAVDPAYAASHQATVGEWADRVIQLKEATKADGTVHMYRVKLGHLVRIFGKDCPLADVTPNNVDAFVAKRRAEGAVSNTIGKELTALLQLCKLARRAGAFTGDVAALKPVGFSIDYKPRIRVITQGEFKAIIAALPPARAAAVALIVATSCRASEFPRVTRAHIDLERNLVHIPGTKTEGSDRVVPIAPMLRPVLAMAIEHLPVSWPGMSHELPELCAKLGLPPVTANDLRRTCATWLIAAGAGHEVVSKVLGHKGTQMVYRVYGQATPEELGRLLEDQTAGTAESQSATDGAECSGGPIVGSACFPVVAPEGVEPSRSFEPGILNPLHDCSKKPKQRDFRWAAADQTPPDLAKSLVVGTRASQFRAAAHAWFQGEA